MKTIIIIFLFFLSIQYHTQQRVVHVLVTLCDNLYQGIVPVPAKIGNGQDPANNLYWGCGYGVKTFFKQQTEWKLISEISNPTNPILERLVFKHKDSLIYLVADAYDGATIKQTTKDFLNYASGKDAFIIQIGSTQITAGGSSNLICYVGHNGLMDFSLFNWLIRTDSNKRNVIILACASKNYFYYHVRRTGAYPLLWTTNLMCPEAYTLDAAIDSWIINDPPDVTREKSAQAYNKYQKCGIKGARNLLVTGF